MICGFSGFFGCGVIIGVTGRGEFEEGHCTSFT